MRRQANCRHGGDRDGIVLNVHKPTLHRIWRFVLDSTKEA